MLPMSCGPSMLPSGHRALCSRLSLCGLCVPFSCGKTDYCRCAGRWGWSLAHLVLRLCLVQWAVPEGRPPTWLDVWPIQAQGCCWPTGRWGQAPSTNRLWEFQMMPANAAVIMTEQVLQSASISMSRGGPSCLPPPWIQDQQAGLTQSPFKLTSTLGYIHPLREKSVSYSSLALLNISPTGFQCQMFWRLVFLV